MSEEGIDSNPEQFPELPKGLSAVILPDLGERNRWGDLSPTTERETLDKLNSFLQELNRQGVDIVHILDVDVDLGHREGVTGKVTETRKFAVVRKKQE